MLHRLPTLSTSALSVTGVPLMDAFTNLLIWIVVLLIGLTAIVSLLRIVFPQQSKDRLAGWRGWWSRPSRRRNKARKR